MILLSKFTIIKFLFLVTYISAQRVEGDTCKSHDGSVGVCKNIEQCQAAKDELTKGNLPLICGFNISVPIVCCPTRDPTRPTRSLNTAQSKSNQKCKQYSSLVYVNEGVTGMIPDSESEKVSQCVEDKRLLIGGIEAEPMEFPHMAAVGFGEKNAINWGCGGSLISERFVLTAAHCTSSPSWGEAKWIRLGGLNLRTSVDNTKTQEFSVTKIIRHPEYVRSYNDIALLQLDRDVKFDGYVRPACLHVGQDDQATRPETIGWGRDWNGSKGSGELLKFGLDFINQEICNDTLRHITGGRRLSVGIKADSMLCAGDLSPGKDDCLIDSGSPLHVRLSEPYCMFDIVGIASFGSVCGFKNAPTVYTRVSHFVPWIESIVWG